MEELGFSSEVLLFHCLVPPFLNEKLQENGMKLVIIYFCVAV